MKNALFVAACLALAAAFARGADQKAAQPAPDRQRMIERHEKMADLHKKAAECLKSGKDVKECHDAMLKECPMKGTGSCPLMGEMCPMCGKGRGMGPGRGRGMRRGMGPMGPGAAPAQTPPADQTPAEEKK